MFRPPSASPRPERGGVPARRAAAADRAPAGRDDRRWQSRCRRPHGTFSRDGRPAQLRSTTALAASSRSLCGVSIDCPQQQAQKLPGVRVRARRQRLPMSAPCRSQRNATQDRRLERRERGGPQCCAAFGGTARRNRSAHRIGEHPGRRRLRTGELSEQTQDRQPRPPAEPRLPFARMPAGNSFDILTPFSPQRPFDRVSIGRQIE